jgi:hypothetical protein
MKNADSDQYFQKKEGEGEIDATTSFIKGSEYFFIKLCTRRVALLSCR